MELQARYRQNFTDMYKTQTEYKKDGLILVNKGSSYNITKTYKWKPGEEQTIDFYCRRCPENLYENVYEKIDGKDLYFLYTGIAVQLQKNLRLVPHEGYNQIFTEKDLDYSKIIPIQFTMPIVPLSYLYYHDTKGPDVDNKIIELSCSHCAIYTEADNVVVDWKLNKVRSDKHAILGIEYGNYYSIAYNIYLNNLEPFPFTLLYDSDILMEQPYFKNTHTAGTIYGAQTSVINYMKSVIISQYANKATTVLDIGAGRGADIYKYIMKQY